MKVIHLKQKRREMRRKPKKEKEVSQLQSRQRELAWLMYVTEGYIGNLKHLREVNAYTMTRADIALVAHAISMAQDISRSVHVAMLPEEKVRVSHKRIYIATNRRS